MNESSADFRVFGVFRGSTGDKPRKTPNTRNGNGSGTNRNKQLDGKIQR